MERIIIRGLTQRWHCVYEELHCSWSIEAKIYKNDNSFKGGGVIPLKEWKRPRGKWNI